MSGPQPPGSGSFGTEPGDESDQPVPEAEPAPDTGVSQASSATEPEQFTSGPDVPTDSALYDYDSYDVPDQLEEQPVPPRWPWIVGITAIVAAVALVVSVSLLVFRFDSANLANPVTTTPPPPPVQDE